MKDHGLISMEQCSLKDRWHDISLTNLRVSRFYLSCSNCRIPLSLYSSLSRVLSSFSS